MNNEKFSTSWKRSTQARKQRKFRYNAPLHVRQKLVHVHLSPELRQKQGTRAMQVRKGDKVKVLRGKFRKQEGKVEKVELKRERVFVTGMDYTKKNGTKIPVPLRPSNLMIVVLDMADKRRKAGKEKLQKKEDKESKSKSGESKK
ncbi:MAG TPA: 50S ribosomal protein L24 [Candidatus Nanoarchaeia archaeon]|nr:50S ribosomal protein L24 [Candidatus Nanoarchaeia archaeon]